MAARRRADKQLDGYGVERKPRRSITTKGLAHAVRSLRELSGMTQSQLARRMRSTQQAVQRAERGESTPSLRTLQRIARACGYVVEIVFVSAAAEKGPNT